MKRIALILVALPVIALALWGIIRLGSGQSSDGAEERIRLRLQWIPQAQFAGFIVARENGFYADVGLDVELLPAGPDLKPQVTVAAGIDDIGIGVVNQVIAARSNGVPLVAIGQVFQDSPNRYVLKAENRIDGLEELRGKKIGLWLGGDEAEFISMLATVDMTLEDVQVIPQGFSVVPFLEDLYIVSQVTVYNELNLIRSQGYDESKLQVLTPRDYSSAILGDVIFTTEAFVSEHPDTVRKFVEASIRGWRFCLDNPTEAVSIVLASNPELQREDQELQMEAVLRLVRSGAATSFGLCYVDVRDYATAERILFESGQITSRVAPETAIDLTAWNAVPESIKRID